MKENGTETFLLDCVICGTPTNLIYGCGPHCMDCIMKMEYHKDGDSLITDKYIRYNEFRLKNSKITIPYIKQRVCHFTGVDCSEIDVKTRKREIVQARQISMAVAKTSNKLQPCYNWQRNRYQGSCNRSSCM